MDRRPLGAHPIADARIYAVARVSGVMVTLWAIFMGVWILIYGDEIFSRPFWRDFANFTDFRLSGGVILLGGVLGVLGLVCRSRLLSLASCALCALWCGVITTFLWYGNVTDYPSVGAFTSLLATHAFIQRFLLLLGHPRPEEPHGQGW